MGGQGRKPIIPLFSPKRYRKRQEPDFPTEERLCLSTTSQSASLDKAGLRLPASAALRLRLAGRCPNSSSLFPPLALGLRLLLFLQPLGGALKKQNAALASPPFICRWQQSAPLQSSPLLPKGEPLAYRTAFCQTPKVYSDVKDSALLQRAATSEQASLSSCCESL